jgi:hypothetical protein
MARCSRVAPSRRSERGRTDRLPSAGRALSDPVAPFRTLAAVIPRRAHEDGGSVTRRQQRILVRPGATSSTSMLRRGHATQAGVFSARRLTLVTVLSLLGLLALTATPAFAARGRVFSTTFGTEGSGPGELNEPWGVAVNEATTGPTAGDVYVADFGNNRVQWFSFNAVSKSYEVAGQITAADGTGTGTLAESSNVIESFAPSSGTLVVGQSIAGAGVPAETKITAVEAFGVVKISNPVEAGKGGSLVSLVAEQPLLEPREIAVDNSQGGPSSGDVYVSSGEFEQVVVDKFTPAGEFVGQISELPPVTGSGDLEAGSSTITSLVASSGVFIEGEAISGAGIPPGTTITGVCQIDACGNNETLELQLSNPVEVGATAAGVALTAKAGPFNRVTGLAVDPSGALLLAEEHAHGFGAISSTFDRFDSSSANRFKRTCGVSESLRFGLAVDSHDNLYVPWRSGGVAELNSECSLLDENIGAKSPAAAAGITRSGVAVEPAAGNVYVDNVESIGQFAASDGSETARFGAGHLAAMACEESVRVTCLGGLAVNGATAGPTAGDVYAAVGTGPARIVVFAPEPPAAPKVESESVDKVTNDSAMLQAEINPHSVTGEASTEYHFAYGPCPGAPATCPGSEYPSQTTVESLAPSFEVDSVSAQLEGLPAETTYHYKVLASNEHGSTEGTERTFTTHGTAAFQLPDGRAWEMVSPAEKQGALIQPLGMGGTSLAVGAATQAAVAGGAVVYAASVPTEPQPAGFPATAEVLSTRGAAGWSSHDISVSHGGPAGALTADELPFYSEDLSVAVVQPTGSAFVPLAEDASEQTAYLRDGATGALTPLVTGCPAAPAPCPPAVQAHANVPAGSVFGQQGGTGTTPCPPSVANCGPQFVAGTSDFKHVLLASDAPLTGVKTAGGKNVLEGAAPLYLRNADAPASQQLQLVTVLPPNGSGEELPAPRPSFGYTGALSTNHWRGALSADGSRVFFSNGDAGGTVHLYMRDTVARKTIQIDLPEQGCNTCGGGAEQPEFDFASSDGSKVFFMDTQKLTENGKEYPEPREASGSPTRGADLYVCEIHEDACTPKDLTPAGTVLGTMPGASRDGTWMYFVANGALVAGAVKGDCPNQVEPAKLPPSSATCNLYAEHSEAGTWGPPRLVTVLSAFDVTDWSMHPRNLTTRISPDGNWLAFMSQRSLTGYDNRDAVSGKPDQELYLYNAEHNQLTCASCNPSGARPHGQEYSGTLSPLLTNTVWEPGTWLSASIPGWVKADDQFTQRYLPRSLADSGRLFFDSYDALVPKDVNGTGDVYEFEPAGVPAGEHSCSSASTSGGVVYRPARAFEVEGQPGEEAAGCVGLISSGTSSEEAAFLDASETGGDVFFISTAHLSTLDVEGGRTVYDAHECSASSPCTAPPPQPPPPCNTESSCKAAPTPQPSIYGPSGSATFSGPGNPAPPPPKRKTAAQVRAEKLTKALKACHKDRKKKKRQACERAAHKAYGAATKANRKAHR